MHRKLKSLTLHSKDQIKSKFIKIWHFSFICAPFFESKYNDYEGSKVSVSNLQIILVYGGRWIDDINGISDPICYLTWLNMDDVAEYTCG